MEELVLVIWYLSKYGKKKGWGEAPEEIKKKFKSDYKMKKHFEKWHKEKRQGEEK